MHCASVAEYCTTRSSVTMAAQCLKIQVGLSMQAQQQARQGRAQSKPGGGHLKVEGLTFQPAGQPSAR